MITLKRAYDPAASGDGKRFLVERLWPRGIRKTSLQIDGWLKEAAPSSELRQWFSHDPAKWPEFRHRYFRELDVNPQAWQTIFDAAAGGGKVTLIYSSHDTEHNNVVALRDYLEKKLEKHRTELRKSDDTPERERPWGDSMNSLPDRIGPGSRDPRSRCNEPPRWHHDALRMVDS